MNARSVFLSCITVILILLITLQLSPTAMGVADESKELVYDDGRVETCWFWKEEGLGGYDAVLFSAPNDSAVITAVKYYVKEKPAAFDVLILDSSRSPVFETTATPTKTGWFNIDLSAEDILVRGDFYVAMKWTKAERPCLGADETKPDSRSFFVYGDSWSTYQEVNLASNNKKKDGDFMIRAVVVPPPPAALEIAEVSLQPGPDEHVYIGDLVRVDYTLQNTGGETASNVEVKVSAPPGIAVAHVTESGDLAPGASSVWEVSLDPESAGAFEVLVSFLINGERQSFPFGDQFKITLDVEARPAFLVIQRVITKPSGDEPFYVGETGTITYTIENSGQMPAENVEIRVVDSPSGVEVVVPPAKDLQPGRTDDWQVSVKATNPGNHEIYVSFYVNNQLVDFGVEGQAGKVERFKATVSASEREKTFFETYGLYLALVAIAVIVLAALLMRRRAQVAPRPAPASAVAPSAAAPMSADKERFCISCGSKIPIADKFCPKCGAQQQ